MADTEVKDINEELKESVENAVDAVSEDKPAMKASTEANRRKKAERREAKAARKEANKIEEKKKRPSNTILAILIFGVVIVMFAFAGGYNYFQKPANLEKYVKDQGIAEIYNDTPVSEYTTLKIRAEENTLKVLFTVAEDAPETELEQFTGDDGTKYLKDIGASFLTSMKPEVRGFGGTVKVGVKQGDKTVNYVKMSYKEAKQYVKEAEKKAKEEAEKAENDSDGAEADADDSDAGADTDTEDSGE